MNCFMNKPKIIQHRLKFLSKPTLLVLLLGGSVAGDVYAKNPVFAADKRVKDIMLENVQQNITIKGKVLSAEDGMGIPGVNVNVKGVAGGVTTDFDGSYNINVSSTDAVLVFSAVGMKTQEIKVGSQKIIDITLKADISALEEVVVVAYGQQKKATLTGAVETISAKTFESRAVTNIGLALQGQTPGLVVTRTSPRPGNEGIAFKIRGNISVNGGSPLIVVDGVPTINSDSFLNLNSDDIESISVLKDGAAAIYGSRSANGVILVTTKSGKGRLKVDYSSNVRFTTTGITSYSPSMSEYASMWLEANKEETVPNYWVWQTKDNLLKMQQGIEGKYDLFGTDFYIYNANRIDEMFARRYSYQHNLSLSNSSDKSSYRLSFGYADNQGNLATAYDGQKQLNARFKYDYKLSDKLNLSTNLSIINTKTSSPSVGLDETLYAFDMPFYPAKNPYGQWFATFNGIDGGAIRNAVAMTSDGGRNDIDKLTGRADIKLTYDITKDLKLEGIASVQNERHDQETYVVPVPLYNWYGVQTGIGFKTGGTNNKYEAYQWKSSYNYYGAQLNYDKTVNDKHHISAMVGVNAEKSNYQWLRATRIGFDDLGVYDINVASTENQSNNGFKSQNGRYSYIGRVNYDYDEKYLITVSGRRDGNSRFAQGFKFKNFGSAELGWVFSKEKFFESLSSVISFGKIRSSIAVSGNDVGIGEFDYLTGINLGSFAFGSTPALQGTSSLANNGLISKTRTWERVQKKNLGLELNFLNNRLTTQFDVFENDNNGMLTNVTYPSVLGGNAPKTNSGHFNTKGWELTIGWKDAIKDFNYNVSFNISDTKTMVDGVENADSYGAGRNNIVNGRPYQSWFVYKTDGYFKDQADVDAYYAAYGNSVDLASLPENNAGVRLRPGDTKKVDVAGTGNITSSGNEKSSLVYAGDGTPHFTFGINSNVSWKGFDLGTTFQGQLKQNVMRNGYMAYPFSAIYTNQNPAFLGKTWTEENPDAIFPRLTVNTTRAKWNYANNDFMLQNNRYIRLKTLIFGYTLPREVVSKLHLSKIRVYFSGNDLWESTSIKDGYDPEQGEASINSGYPFARTWSFGVNVGF